MIMKEIIMPQLKRPLQSKPVSYESCFFEIIVMMTKIIP